MQNVDFKDISRLSIHLFCKERKRSPLFANQRYLHFCSIEFFLNFLVFKIFKLKNASRVNRGALTFQYFTKKNYLYDSIFVPFVLVHIHSDID